MHLCGVVDGLVYVVRNSLYVSLTNVSNTTSLFESRGNAFGMRSFSPLPDSYEPSVHDINAAVKFAFEKQKFDSVVFAGLGEPTLRLETLLEAAKLLTTAQSGLPLRLNTNGLGSLVHGRDIAPELKMSGFNSISVALNTADSRQYQTLMSSKYGDAAFAAATKFVERCVKEGLAVECTAVERPEVDVAAVAALAKSLKASFRSRSYHPSSI